MADCGYKTEEDGRKVVKGAASIDGNQTLNEKWECNPPAKEVQSLCNKVNLKLSLISKDGKFVDSHSKTHKLPLSTMAEAEYNSKLKFLFMHNASIRSIGNEYKVHYMGQVIDVQWTLIVDSKEQNAEEKLENIWKWAIKQCSSKLSVLTLPSIDVKSTMQALCIDLKQSATQTEVFKNENAEELLVVCQKECQSEISRQIHKALGNVVLVSKEYPIETKEEKSFLENFDLKEMIEEFQNIEVDTRGKGVEFRGRSSDIDLCFVKLKQFLKTKKMEKSETLPDLICDLLCMDRTKQYVQGELKRKKINCIWSLVKEEKVVIVLSDKGHSEKVGCEAIRALLKQEEIRKGDYRQLKTSSKFTDFLEKEKGKIVTAEQHSRVLIAATEDVMNDILNIKEDLPPHETSQNDDGDEYKNNLYADKHNEKQTSNESKTKRAKPETRETPMYQSDKYKKCFQLPVHVIEMLDITDFKTKWNKENPLSEIEIISTQRSVCIRGDEEMLKRCQKKIKSCLGDLKRVDNKLSKFIVQFLSTDIPRDYVKHVLATNGKHCCWHFESEESITVYGTTDAEAVNGYHLIRKCVVENHKPSASALTEVLKSKEYLTLVEKYPGKIMTFDTDDGKEIVLVVTDDIDAEVIEKVSELVNKVERKKAETDKGIEEFTKHFTPTEMVMIRNLKKELEKETGMEFCISATGDAIQFTCSRNEKEALDEKFLYACSNLKQNIMKVEFKTDFGELLKYTETRDYIQQKLKDAKLKCQLYYHDHDVEVFAESVKVREESVKVIQECLMSSEFSISAEFFNSAGVANVIQEHQCKAKLVVSGDEAELLATADIFQEIEDMIFDLESTYHAARGSKNVSKNIFISQELSNFLYYQENTKINQLRETLKVNFHLSANNIGIVVEGPKESVTQAQIELVQYINETFMEEEVQFSADTVSSAQLEDKIKDFEERHNCVLTQKKCAENAKPNPFYIVSEASKKSNTHMMFCKGNIVDADVDIVVCPTDKHFQPLGKAAVNIYAKAGNDLLVYLHQDLAQKSENDLSKPNIVNMTGGLNCPFIMLLPLMSLRHNRGNETSSSADFAKDFENAIKVADSNLFYSVAIPIDMVSPEILPVYVKGLLEALKATCKGLTCLREIYVYVSDNTETETRQVIKQTYSDTQAWMAVDFGALFLGKPIDFATPLKADICEGSLLDQKVDVIFNSVAEGLNLNRGAVSKLILNAAGPGIQTELNKSYPTGIQHGKIAVTSSGNIQTCKEICHGALPDWNPTGSYSLMIMRLLLINTLEYANEKGYKSVAIPVIGTGNLEYPWKLVARTMLETIEYYGQRKSPRIVTDVRIVVYRTDIYSLQALRHVEKQKSSTQHSGVIVPAEVLESRIPLEIVSVKIQIRPPLSGQCSADARVKFYTIPEVRKGKAESKSKEEKVKFKNLYESGVHDTGEKDGNQTYVLLSALADTNEKDYKDIISRCLSRAEENRATSLHFELREITDGPGRVVSGKSISCKEQCEWIKHSVAEFIHVGKQRRISNSLCYVNEVHITVESDKNFENMLKKMPATKNINIFKKITNKLTGNKEMPWRMIRLKRKHQSDKCRIVKVIAEKKNMQSILSELQSFQESTEQQREQKTWNESTTLDDLSGEEQKSLELLSEQIFTNISGEIHPSLVDSVQDKDVWKKELEDLVEFDGNNNTKFSTKSLPKMIKASERLRKYTAPEFDEEHYDFSISRSQTDDSLEEPFVHIDKLKIDISEEQYLAMKFFCKDENWMKDIKYEKDHILFVCCGDKGLATAVESKKSAFEMMNRNEITLKGEERKLIQTAIEDVHAAIPGVFCYQLEEDKSKVLRLMGHDYQTLQQAKHRIQIKLGQIKPNETRRNRRFEAKSMNEPDNEDDDDDDDSSSSTRRKFSGHISTSSDQNVSNFVTKEGLSVKVYTGSILHLDVDCIVNAANENLQHGGGIAMVIARAAGYEFDRESRDYIDQNGPLKVGECCTTSAGHLKYKGVIHAVGPRWYDYPNDSFGCLEDLTAAVKEVMLECDREGFTSVAIPAISSGIFGVPKDLCTQQYFRAVTEYSHQDWKSSSSLEEVHFVDKDQGMVSLIATTFSDCCEKDGKMKQASQNFGQMQVKGFGSKSFSSSRSISSSQEFRRRTSSDSEENHEDFSTSRNSLGRSISKEKSFTGSTIGKDENCCICMDEITDPKKLKCGHVFCRDCIDMQFQYKPVCPNCGAVHGKVIGDQPPGTMKVTRSRGSLEGYKDDGIIMIAYSFPAGVQGPDHPHPGTPYEGIYRAAYLPNNKRGKLVCKLLEIAFDRKLVFTIGRSRTTGKEGVVTWNDIHHKTRMDGGPQRFGYPDPTYLDRVMEELEVKGVTEESLNDP